MIKKLWKDYKGLRDSEFESVGELLSAYRLMKMQAEMPIRLTTIKAGEVINDVHIGLWEWDVANLDISITLGDES